MRYGTDSDHRMEIARRLGITHPREIETFAVVYHFEDKDDGGHAIRLEGEALVRVPWLVARVQNDEDYGWQVDHRFSGLVLERSAMYLESRLVALAWALGFEGIDSRRAGHDLVVELTERRRFANACASWARWVCDAS